MKFKPRKRRYSWTLPPSWQSLKFACDVAVDTDETVPEELAAAIQSAKTPRGMIRAIRVFAGGLKDSQEKIESAPTVQSGRDSSVTVAHPNLT